jgi:hypothetical protein
VVVVTGTVITPVVIPTSPLRHDEHPAESPSGTVAASRTRPQDVERLAEELLDRADADQAQLLGPAGLLTRLTSALICLARRRCDVLFAMLRNRPHYQHPEPQTTSQPP